MPDHPSTIRAVAFKHGQITALGADRAAVDAAAPPGSTILDFPHACVLPGFWDTHVHVAAVGGTALACRLYHARSIAEIVDRLAEHAARNPTRPVLAARAGNLDPAALADGRLPAANDLDAAEQDRPVVLSDVNKCIGNTAALAAAGLTAATPDPPGGALDRHQDGRPTGVAWFSGGKALLEAMLPLPRPEEFADRFAAGLECLAERGITTAVEAQATVGQIDAIRQLDAEGRLACRVVVQPAASTDDQLRAFEASTLTFGEPLGPRSCLGPAKLFFDRFVMHRSARMTQPYAGQPENLGDYFTPPDQLAARLRAVLDRGFPAAIHVTGDRGVAEALEACTIELGRRGAAAPAGSYLIHAYLPPPGAPARMAELGIGLAAQPPFLYHWADTLARFLGRERAERFYPFDEYLAAGVTVAGGSDGPITDPDPLLSLHALTARQSASGRAWGPEHALSMDRALELHTGSAARLVAWSGLRGDLAVGAPADLVVLDRDPRATPGDVRSIRVLATFVGGRETYRARADGP